MASKRKGAAEPVAAVNKVLIVENNDPLVDLMEYCPDILISDPPQWIRQRVAAMLSKAQSLLPEGHHLQVRIVWRSLDYQKQIYRRVYRKFRKEHPDWPENTLRRQTNRYVAPPHEKAPPGHTTGGAVDLTIIGPSGEELDMVSPFKGYRDGGFETFSPKISPEASRNRGLLYGVMMKAGFSNCAAEWWHYSYGDSAWAVRTGRKSCCYGAVSAPSLSGTELKARQELSRKRKK